jgi:hypothetical protein
MTPSSQGLEPATFPEPFRISFVDLEAVRSLLGKWGGHGILGSDRRGDIESLVEAFEDLRRLGPKS